MKKVFKLLALVLILMVLASCGSRKSPTGGPEDIEKPEVLTSLPQQFSQISDKIEITFSKSMDKSTVAQGIYIYPHIEAKKISLADRVLTIIINEPLQKDTNYYVTLTTRVKDTRGNPLSANQTMVYASGKFHDNRLAGTVAYEDRTDAGQAVQMSLFSADSLLVLSREINGGAYAIDGLNPAEYQVRAYLDKNRNGRYDHTAEPWFEKNVQVRQMTNLDIHLTYADTTLAVIRSAKAVSNREVQVTFSEAPAAFKNIAIIDPLSNKLLAVQMSELEGDRLTIITSAQDSVKYDLRVTGISDAKGNVNQVSGLGFMGTKRPDKDAPKVMASLPRNGTSVATLLPILEVHFNEIIPKSALKVTLSSTDSNSQIPVQIISADSRICRFKPSAPLTNYRSHLLRISSETTDSSGNRMEADYLLNFLPLIPSK
jgi:methionine-rich copper-binding protein CopC